MCSPVDIFLVPIDQMLCTRIDGSLHWYFLYRRLSEFYVIKKMAEQKPFHLTRHTSIYFEIEWVISKNGIDLLLCYIFMEFTIFFSCRTVEQQPPLIMTVISIWILHLHIYSPHWLCWHISWLKFDRSTSIY